MGVSLAASPYFSAKINTWPTRSQPARTISIYSQTLFQPNHLENIFWGQQSPTLQPVRGAVYEPYPCDKSRCREAYRMAYVREWRLFRRLPKLTPGLGSSEDASNKTHRTRHNEQDRANKIQQTRNNEQDKVDKLQRTSRNERDPTRETRRERHNERDPTRETQRERPNARDTTRETQREIRRARPDERGAEYHTSKDTRQASCPTIRRVTL